MKKMLSLTTRQRIVNVFGVIGYFLAAAAYGLLMIALFALFVDTTGGGQTSSPTPVAHQPLSTPPIEWALPLALIVTVIVLGVSTAIIAFAPSVSAKLGSRWLRRCMKTLKVSMTSKNLLTAKMIVALLPLVVFMIVSMFDIVNFVYIGYYIAGEICGVLAVFFFGLQHILARYAKLAAKYID